uniref:Peptidase M12A domain-containing protein n=1 Tax=Periophthalmus magnuspinnatus TaxID=409849 RepID=A0A3B4B4W9_9GOBI
KSKTKQQTIMLFMSGLLQRFVSECYAMLLRSCLWPKGANGLVTIRFTISSGFGSYERYLISQVMQGFHSSTCVIENQRGCYSALGRQGGRQGLSLNRQGYSDRDSYITINWNNMNQQMAYNYFLKSTNYLNTPYDYFPIMQYERTFFINGQDTIIPKSRHPHQSETGPVLLGRP